MGNNKTIKVKSPSGAEVQISANKYKSIYKPAGYKKVEGTAPKPEPETQPEQQPAKPKKASELDNQLNTERDVAEVQEQTQNKQKAKDRVLKSYQNLQDKNTQANEAFIQAAAQAAEGRKASEEELQPFQDNEFGLRGASAKQVMERFGLLEETDDMGMEDEQPKQEGQQGTQKGTQQTEPASDKQEAIERRQDTFNKISSLYKDIQTNLKDIQDRTFEEERGALVEAENQLQDIKTELEQQKIMDRKELKDLEDEPISNAAIIGEKQDLSFEQKTDLIMKQQEYNNALIKKKIAQNDLTRARDIAQQTANDYLQNAELQLQALKTKGNYQDQVIDRLRIQAQNERDLRMNGWIPIDEDQLDAKIKEYAKQKGITPETFEDPITGQSYIRPRQTEEDISQYSWEKVGEDDQGNAKYGRVNLKTGKVLPHNTKSVPGTVNVGGYDISSYATDPNHEQKVATIYNEMGKFENETELSNYINDKFPDSPVTAEMIQNTSAQYNVSWEMLTSIMQQDSSMGTAGKAIRTKNPGNVGNDDEGNLVEYKDWQSGVDAVGRWLDRNRVEQKQKTKASEVYTERDLAKAARDIPDMNYEEVVNMSVDDFNQKMRDLDKGDSNGEDLSIEESYKKDIDTGEDLEVMWNSLEQLGYNPLDEDFLDLTTRAIKLEIKRLGEDDATTDEIKSHLRSVGVSDNNIKNLEGMIKKYGVKKEKDFNILNPWTW